MGGSAEEILILGGIGDGVKNSKCAQLARVCGSTIVKPANVYN